MPHIDLPAFGVAIDQAIGLAREQVFRLETLQAYDETDDPDALAAYEAVDRDDLREARMIQERVIVSDGVHARIRERGLKFRRVRLVRRPFSEYLWYEFAIWKVNQKHGEEILIVEEKDLDVLRHHEFLHDFILVDERLALFNEYRGRIFSGGDLSEDPHTLRDCALLRDGLLWIGTPLNDFLAKEEKPGWWRKD